MPIGNLLASITGEQPTPSPTVRHQPVLPPKRKAEDVPDRPPAPKIARTSTGGTQPPPPTVIKPSYGSSDRLGNGSTTKPAGARPASAPRPRPTTTNGVNPMNRQNGRDRPTGAVSAGSTVASSGPAAAKAPPKKGSFAEIMARGKDVQKIQANVGKIQHKPLEKGPSKVERPAMKGEASRGTKVIGSRVTKGPASAAVRRVGPNGAMNGNRSGDPSSRVPGRPGAVDSSVKRPAKNGPAAEPEVKRVKKAAIATTGYQGTARPQPARGGASGAAGRNSGSRSPERKPKYRMPFGAERNRSYRRDDYYDEEMDDFIDDDDEGEEDYGRPRYSHADDDEESDMEAGMSDIDEEERRAERAAIEDDKREAKLEADLKREKEARKRGLLSAAAAKRR